MHYFIYHAGELYCEEVPVKKIVEKYGTPLYIYSGKTIRRHFKVFDSVFSEIEHLTCYSVKANSNIGVLALLAREGAGADIVSGESFTGPLRLVFLPRKSSFQGLGRLLLKWKLLLRPGFLCSMWRV